MTHVSEDQLVLFYYGEREGQAEVDQHLAACDECRSSYQALQRVLNSVDALPVPERPADYEAQVWNAISAKLPRKTSLSWKVLSGWFQWQRLAWAGGLAALIAVAFLAGRGVKNDTPVQVGTTQQPPVRERVLMVAMGDHLERTELVLAELTNAEPGGKKGLDISFEQQTAEELLDANRLYRQTAASEGDGPTADLLEDLERVLIEIARSPSRVSAAELEDLKTGIEDRGILFKVKVFGSQLRQREEAPIEKRTQKETKI
jgi:hypothetical protein